MVRIRKLPSSRYERGPKFLLPLLLLITLLQIQYNYNWSIVVDGFPTTIPTTTTPTTRIVRGNKGNRIIISTASASIRRRLPPTFVTSPSLKTSSCRRCCILPRVVLFSTRNRDDDEFIDKRTYSSYYDDDVDDNGPSTTRTTRFVGETREEIDLNRVKRMDYPSRGKKNQKNTSYDDDADDVDGEDVNEIVPSMVRAASSSRRTIPTRPSDRNKSTRYREFDDDDDDDGDDNYYYDDDELQFDDDYEPYDEETDDDDDDIPTAGNFWSNPAGGIDSSPSGLVKKGPLTRPRMVEVPRRSSRREDDDDDDDSVRLRPRPRRPRATSTRRSPVRSYMPKPPRVIADFYDKLFWFGFDSSGSGDVGDKTMFGGTKGKFNGLAYLRASEENQEKMSSYPSSSRSRNDVNGYGSPQRRLPPARKTTRRYDVEEQDEVDYDDYYEDDGDYAISNRRDNYDDVDDDGGKLYSSSRRSRRYIIPFYQTPPFDSPEPRTADSVVELGRSSRDPPPQRRRPRRRRPELSRSASADDSRSWVPKQVTTWFTPEDGGGRFGDEYDDGDIVDDYERRDGIRDSTRRRSERRQERRGGGRNGSVKWSPLTMLDSFLGYDREAMAYKADMYDYKMGVTRSNRYGSGRRQLQRQTQLQPQRRSARDYPGRSGYAYRYDSNVDDDDEDVVDLDPPLLDDDIDVTISSQRRRKQPTSGIDDGEVQRSSRRKEQTWEERAMAVERVPPASVAAWGPSGELPMTARMKAIIDALQDVATARRKLDARVKKESLARDEVTMLKVDAERQRLKIEESQRGGSRSDLDQLRQIELDIDDAARALRRAKTLVEMSRDEVEELQERHWAVLSFYNPEQASVLVGEALNEFSASFGPPAASGGLGIEQSKLSTSQGDVGASSPGDTNGASADMAS